MTLNNEIEEIVKDYLNKVNNTFAGSIDDDIFKVKWLSYRKNKLYEVANSFWDNRIEWNNKLKLSN